MKRTSFWNTLFQSKQRYNYYLTRLLDLSISLFKWDNMPETVDISFLEKKLFFEGKALFFKDEVMGFLALPFANDSKLNVYNLPYKRRAYANNGYQNTLNSENSVIIFNNLCHENLFPTVSMYALRLADIDSTIDVNLHNQKTPLIINCDENQRLSMMQVYQKYDGNQPIIFGTKNLGQEPIKVLKTEVPFIATQLYEMKQNIWNDALAYLGIYGITNNSRERLLTDEIKTMNSTANVSIYSRLESRQKACKRINKLFGLDISCSFRADMDALGKRGDMNNE